MRHIINILTMQDRNLNLNSWHLTQIGHARKMNAVCAENCALLHMHLGGVSQRL